MISVALHSTAAFAQLGRSLLHKYGKRREGPTLLRPSGLPARSPRRRRYHHIDVRQLRAVEAGGHHIAQHDGACRVYAVRQRRKVCVGFVYVEIFGENAVFKVGNFIRRACRQMEKLPMLGEPQSGVMAGTMTLSPGFMF